MNIDDSPQMTDDHLRRLVAFLQDAFTSAELERLLFSCGGAALVSQLTGGAHAAVAHETGQILRRNGLLDRLFRELPQIRPARTAEIERLRDLAAVGFARPADANDPSPSTRAALRCKVMTTLRSDADFDAFCHDLFPSVYTRFSDGMQRTAKTTLLILHTDHRELLRMLDEWAPDR